ncbi:hypothetical protein ACWEWI_26005 [Streptomyces sp. NPDC003753]
MNTYDDARASLDTAATMQTAARARPVAAWHPPFVGLGFAVGLSALGLADDLHPWQWVIRAVALLLVVAAVAVPFVAARRSGVMAWSGGSSKDRRKNGASMSLAVVVALLVDAAAGGPWFFIVLGCGLGAAAWIRLAGARKA